MNPRSMVSLYGRVAEAPHFLKDGQGNEFALRMPVAVKRNYRSKDGEYHEDVIPVKYKYEEELKQFVHGIETGDLVSISGTLRSESYKGKKLFYVLADALSFDEQTREKKYKGCDQTVSAEFEIDLPLPL